MQWNVESLVKDKSFKDIILLKDPINNLSNAELVDLFGVSLSTIHRAKRIILKEEFGDFKNTNKNPKEVKAKKSKSPSEKSQFKSKVLAAQVEDRGNSNPELSYEDLKNKVSYLEERLSQALKNTREYPGGKLTLLISDIHLCGRDHMLHCYEEMCQRTLAVLETYKPSELHVILNGDVVAGTGIYRNQYMDTIVQSATDQVKMAAYKLAVFDELLKSADVECPVTWYVISGNHDRSMGENIAPYVSSMARELGVNSTYAGDHRVINLAHTGNYFVYIEHGYGYSKLSPSGSKWLEDLSAKILNLQNRNFTGPNRIRRAIHGHTHWHQVGIERYPDVYVDTTGGCQRNERTILGKNPRPMGFIAYYSPVGSDTIIDPISIRPSYETFQAEWDDPELYRKNMIDCSNAIAGYESRAQELGISDTQGWEGR